MKILILLALFSAIAAASYRGGPGEQPKPAAWLPAHRRQKVPPRRA